GGNDGGALTNTGDDASAVHTGYIGVGAAPDDRHAGAGPHGGGELVAVLIVGEGEGGAVEGHLDIGALVLQGHAPAQVRVGHAGDKGGDLGAGDGGVGGEGARRVVAGEDTRPVEAVDGVVVGGPLRHVGDHAVIHGVDGL